MKCRDLSTYRCSTVYGLGIGVQRSQRVEYSGFRAVSGLGA